MDPGDERAHVAQSRGFKHWMGADDRDNHISRGMSVEASVNVSLTCHQSIEAIKGAAMTAGELAEDIANDAINSMDEYLFTFMEDGKR